MLKKGSASQKAYEHIRDKILNGDYEKGKKLTEVMLAEDLGVSRTPIREALKKLEEEGLLVNKRVINPSEKDLINTFDVRILLEAHACRCAASFMDASELQELSACIHEARTGSNEEIMAANKRFHDLIVHSSRNKVLIETIERMQSIIFLFRRTVVYHKRPHLIDEHEEIFQAIEARDPALAEQLMKDHLRADLEFSLHAW
ncbi:GntR family transcriptional regulator [Alkalicoccus luteus]|uniref:GntR family transcriptional regulator n=1 Tax=Alkalicoccus luteus TaxID=1237094 RepID=A0A969PQE2_9BACI|nr:GntR family transcriptional regulator [Alkalicoccus luteus]NJP36063.1 GntR family transcriptional regulator [Alkalicoccus luteus]